MIISLVRFGFLVVFFVAGSWTTASAQAILGGLNETTMAEAKRGVDDSDSGDEPTLRWEMTLGLSDIDSPAVFDGVVYTGSEGGALTAFDAATGEVLWRSDAGIFTSRPTVADGVIYVRGAGYIYALNAEDGSERWRFETGAELNLSIPSVRDGVVVFCDDSGSSADPAVVAIDASTAQEQWRVEREDEGWCSPLIEDGTVFACDREGHVYAIDLATGSELWHVRPVMIDSPFPFCDALAIADGIIYFANGPVSPLVALDATTGEELWRSELYQGIATPVIANGTVFVTFLHDGELAALDAQTGQERWRTSFGTEGADTPVFADGTLYLGLVLERWDPKRDEPWSRGIGALAAVDAASGDELWRIELDGLLKGPPAVSDGVAYVVTDRGTFLAFE